MGLAGWGDQNPDYFVLHFRKEREREKEKEREGERERELATKKEMKYRCGRLLDTTNELRFRPRFCTVRLYWDGDSQL